MANREMRLISLRSSADRVRVSVAASSDNSRLASVGGEGAEVLARVRGDGGDSVVAAGRLHLGEEARRVCRIIDRGATVSRAVSQAVLFAIAFDLIGTRLGG